RSFTLSCFPTRRSSELFDFVARVEVTPANVKPGQTYRINDLELASRLSYFLWNTAPDIELINLASQNRLHEPLVLEKQVKRMLADRKSTRLNSSHGSIS